MTSSYATPAAHYARWLPEWARRPDEGPARYLDCLWPLLDAVYSQPCLGLRRRYATRSLSAAVRAAAEVGRRRSRLPARWCLQRLRAGPVDSARHVRRVWSGIRFDRRVARGDR